MIESKSVRLANAKKSVNTISATTVAERYTTRSPQISAPIPANAAPSGMMPQVMTLDAE